jgi:hypothetical protein
MKLVHTMKRAPFAVVCVVLNLGGVTLADESQTNAPFRLSLALVDGSHIIGIPSVKSIPVQTSYAKMDIPLEHILSIEIEDDHETALFAFQNGDKLRGVVDIQPLELQAIFGSVSVGIEHIRRITTVASFSWPTNKETVLVRFRAIDQDDIRGEKYRLRLNDGQVIIFDEKKNASRDGTETDKDYELYEVELENVRLRHRGNNVLSFELVSQGSFSCLGFKVIDFRTESGPRWTIKHSDPKVAKVKVVRERLANTTHYYIDHSRQEQAAGIVDIKGLHYKKKGHGYYRAEIHF